MNKIKASVRQLASSAFLGVIAFFMAPLAGADLIDDPLFFPFIEFNSAGTLVYDVDSDLLSIDAAPVAIRLDPTEPPILIEPGPGGKDLILRALVNSAGQLAGGVDGADFQMTGEVDLGGGDVRSGVLLEGEVTAFGFEDSGLATDFFDFRVQLTGGMLAAEYGGAGVEIGIAVTSEGSTFEGRFDQEIGFEGGAKGTIGGLEAPQDDCEIAVDKTCRVLAANPAEATCQSELAAVLLRYIGPNLRASSVEISASGFTASYPLINLVSTVTLLDRQDGFSIDAGATNLGAAIDVSVNGVSESLDTTCAGTMHVGMPAPLAGFPIAYSPNWAIEGFRDSNGNVYLPDQGLGFADACEIAGPGADVEYAYEVTNVGSVDMFGVTVLDSELGAIPGTPFRSLPVGMTRTATTTAFIDVTTTNEVTVTGVTLGGRSCAATDSVTVEVLPGSICLPTIDFEIDAEGASLATGQIVDDEFAAYGMSVTTDDPTAHPAMIFDSAAPTGGDYDLGTPHEDFGGPGVGDGGGDGQPGRNAFALGKLLIISEDGDQTDPDDNADSGTLIFTFAQAVELESVGIIDIDNDESMGVVTAYDALGGVLLAVDMQMLGSNSVQRLQFGVSGVRRLDVWFPSSGGVTDIVFCPPDDFCVEPAVPDPLYSSSSGDHAFYLPDIARDFVFRPDPGSFAPDAETGTATLSGRLESRDAPDQVFDVAVEFTGFTTEPPPGSPKKSLSDEAYSENGGPIDTSTWVYYADFTGTLTGRDSFEGAIIEFVPDGPAFQQGFGANNKNLHFGASAWFDWTLVRQPDTGVVLPYAGDGDMNLNFNEFCVPEPVMRKAMDKFDNLSFDNNDGPDSWAGAWLEDDPESGGSGPDSGAVKIRNDALRLDDREDTGGEPSVARTIDLSGGFASATLSFDFRVTDGIDESDAIAVEVSSDGGASYALLERLTGYDSETEASRSYDISGFISADTTVRFRVDAYYGGSDEYFYADNVTVSAQ